ncbi:MAG: substrate-binding domain-containing protein [Acidobacteria bacterium]|nr:substrate-binding domain-containing protein [Acidobacteriota bacterium]
MHTILFRTVLECLLPLLLATAAVAGDTPRLRFATTTSVQDSGLLPFLLPRFEERYRCRVHVIAVGTGQALRLASSGDVDLVLVHAPDAELEFVKQGYGINRKTLMVNDFVILGPPADPARIRGMKSASEALAAIAGRGAVFVSRGDDSGTHHKERAIWKKAGITPSGPRYLEIGQGMGAALTMAGEKGAYTISDRATYLGRRERRKLEVLSEGDPDLLNHYSAIQVNPARFPTVNAPLARELVHWLCSPEGQKLIGDFRPDGHALFQPVCEPGK